MVKSWQYIALRERLEGLRHQATRLKAIGLTLVYTEHWKQSDAIAEVCRDMDALLASPAPVMTPQNEFCHQCGAGIGKFRRDGEGTCPECDETISADKI